jgi:PadR family transcriptional regulator PadR
MRGGYDKMAETLRVQLKKGVMDLCVLALLSRQEAYAYEIASRLAEDVGMGEGTIYPLMRRLQDDGFVTTYLVESNSGPTRKYYQLTAAGRKAYAAQKAEWADFVSSINRALGDHQ